MEVTFLRYGVFGIEIPRAAGKQRQCTMGGKRYRIWIWNSGQGIWDYGTLQTHKHTQTPTHTHTHNTYTLFMIPRRAFLFFLLSHILFSLFFFFFFFRVHRMDLNSDNPFFFPFLFFSFFFFPLSLCSDDNYSLALLVAHSS